jgi:hypothetical protein
VRVESGINWIFPPIPGFIVNIPDGSSYSPEEKDDFEKRVKQKLTGSSNASNFILSFNGRDVEINVTPFPTNENIHSQWSFLTEECKRQIMSAHKTISPSIIGLSTASGFSSVADEMDMAENQLYKRVINPKQRFITDAIEEILVQYGINLNLYFKPLTDVKIEPEATQLSTHTSCNHDNEASYEELSLYAMDSPEGYELTDGAEYDLKLAATSKSTQDTKEWKIRYAYAKGTSKNPEGGHRSFCRRMLRLADSGKVFREEDIIKMGKDGVNSKFAPKGENSYSIWLYGGGVNCYHRWERRIFKKKKQKDGKLFEGNPMQNVNPVNVGEAKRQGAKLPRNAADVAIAEIDKPNNGSLKNN